MSVTAFLQDAFQTQAQIEARGIVGNFQNNWTALLIGEGATGENGTVGRSGSYFLEELRQLISRRPIIPDIHGNPLGNPPGSIQGAAQVAAATAVPLPHIGGRKRKQRSHTLRKKRRSGV